MMVQMLTVDILDDREPIVYVQKFVYNDRTFQVFRKLTEDDGPIEVSPGIEIDRALVWGVPVVLLETADELEGMPELFAVVCLDEENPPAHVRDELLGAEPYLCIAYDPDERLYRCESTLDGYEALDEITAPTLDEALMIGIGKLHTLLAQRSHDD